MCSGPLAALYAEVELKFYAEVELKFCLKQGKEKKTPGKEKMTLGKDFTKLKQLEYTS